MRPLSSDRTPCSRCAVSRAARQVVPPRLPRRFQAEGICRASVLRPFRDRSRLGPYRNSFPRRLSDRRVPENARRVAVCFSAHLVAQCDPITSKKRNEIEGPLLVLPERIERPPRGGDLHHEVGVLFFGAGDKAALEAIEAPRQVGAEATS